VVAHEHGGLASGVQKKLHIQVLTVGRSREVVLLGQTFATSRSGIQGLARSAGALPYREKSGAAAFISAQANRAFRTHRLQPQTLLRAPSSTGYFAAARSATGSQRRSALVAAEIAARSNCSGVKAHCGHGTRLPRRAVRQKGRG
jgi:hypothetical protein